jgi:hypothetical protein
LLLLEKGRPVHFGQFRQLDVLQHVFHFGHRVLLFAVLRTVLTVLPLFLLTSRLLFLTVLRSVLTFTVLGVLFNLISVFGVISGCLYVRLLPLCLFVVFGFLFLSFFLLRLFLLLSLLLLFPLPFVLKKRTVSLEKYASTIKKLKIPRFFCLNVVWRLEDFFH